MSISLDLEEPAEEIRWPKLLVAQCLLAITDKLPDEMLIIILNIDRGA